MRRLVAVLIITGCTTATTPPPTPPATPAPRPATPYGFTIDEEAQILRFEDRREYDAATFERWVHHPNVLHRQRIALALGRIGPSMVNDRNAVLNDLLSLANDRDSNVRVTTAFALGQIGDIAATDTLLQLAADRESADVAAEAVEALSKLAPKLALAPYAQFAEANQREGVRARAIEFLFRFRSDDA